MTTTVHTATQWMVLQVAEDVEKIRHKASVIPLLAIFLYVHRYGVKRSGGLSSLQLACNQAEWGVLCGAAAGGLGSLGLGSLVGRFQDVKVEPLAPVVMEPPAPPSWSVPLLPPSSPRVPLLPLLPLLLFRKSTYTSIATFITSRTTIQRLMLRGKFCLTSLWLSSDHDDCNSGNSNSNTHANNISVTATVQDGPVEATGVSE